MALKLLTDSLNILKFGKLKCPVKLDFSSEKINNLFHPLKRDGNLVYAFPGGKEFS